MSNKKKIKINEEFLENIDQFLLNNKDDSLAKKEAFHKLDYLIRSDLSNSLFLNSANKAKDKIDQELEKESLRSSANILDLRLLEKGKKSEKFKENKKLKLKVPQIILAHWPVKRINFNFPEFNFLTLNYNWQGLYSKVIIFALILFITLLPLKGFVFFAKIQKDKPAFLNLGQEGLIGLRSGLVSASETEYNSAKIDFKQALNSFSTLKELLEKHYSWTFNIASNLPFIGETLSLGDNLLNLATNISQAGLVFHDKLETQEDLTEYLSFISERIEKVLPYLTNSENNLKEINLKILPNNLEPYIEDLRISLPNIISNLETLESVFNILTDILGHASEKRYLVLFQNNNELRATGGFIGSFAVLDIYQGRINNLGIPKGGTYDLTAGQKALYQSPRALSLIAPHFYIWDANWWPDFSFSATKILKFYEEAGNSSVDGVLAINAEFLKELLKVIGPVVLEDYNIVITADNVFTTLQREVELNYDQEKNEPKTIIADLAPRILEELFKSDQKKKIASILVKALTQKDIQIFLTAEKKQAEIKKFNWSGNIQETNKDYLLVVNTNLAGGKTDNKIYQTIDHQVEIQNNGDIIDTLRITKVNNNSEDDIFKGYENNNIHYIRIYTPLGSEFIEAFGFDDLQTNLFHFPSNQSNLDKDIAREEEGKMIDNLSHTEIYESLGKTVFANWSKIKPGETKTFSLKYKLPFKIKVNDSLVNNWLNNLFKRGLTLDNYSLLIQSQSGMQNTILNSAVILPKESKIIWQKTSEKKELNIIDSLVTYSTELNQDQYFGFVIASK